MRAYTLHLPPAASTQAPILMVERFSWWGLFFGPFWLMRHGVWWWGLAALAVVILAPPPAVLAVFLLCGFCGPDARRAALTRRGWQFEAVVIAPDAEAALKRVLTERPVLTHLFHA